MNENDQLANFVKQTEHIKIPTQIEGDDQPQIPFPTSYKLTGKQERELIDHAMQRLTELEDEMGRTCTGETNWYESTDWAEAGSRSFLGKRQLFEMLYHNQVEWRPHLLGGIFEQSNLVVPLARRIVRQMIARANNYFFSTDPWFAVYPVGVDDRELAVDIERYTRFKFDKSKMKHVLELAVELAFVRGETVIKTVYKTDEQIYQQFASVLIDEQGQDVFDANGDHITEEDLWIPQMQEQQDPETGEVVQVPTGLIILKRDQQTPQPDNMIFEQKLITRKINTFAGAESAIVYYKDFLCSPSAKDLQEADCLVHLYDMPVMSLADTYQRNAMLDMSNEESMLATQKAIEMIRNMSTESGAPKASRNKYRPELGESDSITNTEQSEPIVEIAEFHLRYDANGDGIMEDIMLVLDKKNKVPIFYDYIANVTPNGLRPFDVVKINQVDGRWHGIGAMEMFESSQVIVDLLVNRWNLSQSRSGRVDLWNPHNTLEGDSNRDLTLNWGGTYTPKPGKSAKDILEFISLPDIKHDAIQNMFQLFMQLSTNESGVSNANDAASVGLNTSELATGVRNIEKSGQEMFALYLSHLEPGLQSAIQRAMLLIFANINEKETFTYFEGDTMLTGQIDRESVRDIDLNVSLLLTRYRGEQLLQSSIQAANLTAQFYSFPPEVQQRVAPLYRDMLKALQINFADEIINAVPAIQSGTAPGKPNVDAAKAASPMKLKPLGQAEANL